MIIPKKIILFVAFTFNAAISIGQEVIPNMCGTGIPDSTWESWFSQKVREYKKNTVNQRTITEYNVPVIVHILHNGDDPNEEENISWEQVNSQIEVLNDDFAAENSDYNNTPIPFQSSRSGDTGIRFCLAKVDTNGVELEEEGIDRINWVSHGWTDPDLLTQSTYANYFNDTIKPASIWDCTKYLNIWVFGSETNTPFTFGYTLFPEGIDPWGIGGSNIETEMTSGIVMWDKVFGNTGTVLFPNNPYNNGRSGTHEVGHWLGLRHISGDVQCTDFYNLNWIWTDHCDDTPRQLGGYLNPHPEDGQNYGCPTFPHFQNICLPPNENGEMFMNYMDYTNDTCRFMFTEDQAERMQTAMMAGTYRIPLANSTACQDPCPDLIVINQSISQNQCLSGDSITVFFKEKNIGGLTSDSNHISFHLSANDVLTPGQFGDTYLGEYPVDQNIPPQSLTMQFSKDLLIPLSINPGTYYLFFSADGAQEIDECNELNNFATVIVSVSDSITISEATYRYWFDNQFSQAISTNHSQGYLFVLEDSIATTSLPQGLHTFHIAFKDTSDLWSSTISSMFLKANTPFPAGSARYDYWFDNNFNSRIVKTINSTSNLFLVRNLNMGSLNPGLHSFSIRLKPDGRHWSSAISSLFYKITPPFPAGPSQYEYWFDQDYAAKTNTIISASTNLFLLDSLTTDSLTSGLHTFNIRFKPDGTHWSSSVSNLFYKIDLVHPEGNPQFEYWFGDNYSDKVIDSIASTNNLIIVDSFPTASLSQGLHAFHLRSKPDGKHWSSTTSDLFYKVSSVDSEIIKYQYWFDTNFQDTITVNVPGTENLYLISMIDSMEIPKGLHSFHIRHQQSNGLWSSVTSDLFYKNDPAIVNNKIVRFVYWYDNDWQNSQTIFLPGLENDSLTVYINAEDLSLGDHTVNMFFRDEGFKWSSIVTDSFSRIDIPLSCPFNDKQFTAGVIVESGATYQWQVDAGTGFLDVVNDTVYSGSTSDTLQLNDAPTNWYGNKYRCLITTINGIITSEVFTLKFSLTWDGSEGTAWENPLNWSCSALPDQYTDVYIKSSSPIYPEVNSNQSCRSLNLQPGAIVVVKSGYNLLLTGNE